MLDVEVARTVGPEGFAHRFFFLWGGEEGRYPPAPKFKLQVVPQLDFVKKKDRKFASLC